MRPIRSLLLGLLAASSTVAALAGAAGAASKPSATHKTAKHVVIGYEGFAESQLMAYIYGDLLKQAGYTFSVKNAGSRTVAVPAIEKGALDVLPEYAGSLTVYLDSKAQKQAGKIQSALSLVNSKLSKKGVVALAPTSGLDQNVFVVTKATSTKYHLTKLSQLASHAKSWTLGAPPECTKYYFCAPGLKSVYGIKFKTVKGLDESGPITVRALQTGQAQVAELFSTDGVIAQDHFVQLADDKNLEPADHLIPLVRKSLDTSKVKTALAKANKLLTTGVLIRLEDAMSTGSHPSAATVAAGFLAQEKLG